MGSNKLAWHHVSACGAPQRERRYNGSVIHIALNKCMHACMLLVLRCRDGGD